MAQVAASEGMLEFERQSGNAYRLTYAVNDNPSVMEAHLFRISGESFLDLYTTDKLEGIQPPPIPSHFLLRVYQVTPTVKLAPLSHGWLKEVLAKNPKAVRHHTIKTGDGPDDIRLVLTAGTSELQQFLTTHLQNPEAWKDGFELERDSVTSAASK